MINPTDSQMEYERDEFLSILQDLIAELRTTGCVLHLEPIDRAEARLNELNGVIE